MSETVDLLRSGFQWRGDATDPDYRADVTGWWRDPDTLRLLGPALAALGSTAEHPTVVLSFAVARDAAGALVALHLGVGLVEIRKEPGPAADSDAWRVRTTPPDYEDRHLRMGFRRELIRSGDRVLFVDDRVATGGQVTTARALVADSGATWLGASVVVDGLGDPARRRDLTLRCLVRLHDLR